MPDDETDSNRSATSQTSTRHGSLPPDPLDSSAPIAPENTPNLHGPTPDRQRFAQLAAEPIPEPSLDPIVPESTPQSLRDQTKFAIISRLLFRNATNLKIVEALAEAGFQMSERTMQKIVSQSDFREYYTAFRNAALGPLDKQIREDIRLAMPEAYNQLLRVMRSARSDATRLEAVRMVLETGGAIRRERTDKRVTVNLTGADLEKIMRIGQRVTSVIEIPDTLPESEPS